MSDSLKNIYAKHHADNRPENFSILEKERGDLLKDTIGLNKKVLDIGCRDGVLTKHFSKDNNVLGVDIDEGALAKAKASLGIETLSVDLNGDWRELKDRKFDVIVAGEVLEHLYFPKKIASQVAEHLNKDGMFIGSVPNAFSLKHRMRYLSGSKKYTPLSDPTHINQFSFSELNTLFEEYFKDVEIIGLGRYKMLSHLFPSFVAFDFFFICKGLKND